MNTHAPLIWVEELLVWIFDHEKEFKKEFFSYKRIDDFSVYISSHYVLVLFGDTNIVIPINEVINWIEAHNDGY